MVRLYKGVHASFRRTGKFTLFTGYLPDDSDAKKSCGTDGLDASVPVASKTVDQLKQLLKARGLRTTGRKNELIARLTTIN